ncbi:MAG: hypothetical protein KJ070_24715, partial [Verrucomicrobia bacterium]|nr:hypothetical protein [Verrucomicrobiota bacterium]
EFKTKDPGTVGASQFIAGRLPGVAQVSQPAVSPTSSRLAQAQRGRPGIRSVCGLEIRDPADWKSALQHRLGAPCKKMRCALELLRAIPSTYGKAG